jgi:hypothetical protein
MDRLFRFPLLLLLAALAALAACGTLPTPIARSGDFGVAQTYAIGETRVFEDGLAVTLVRIDDSRCKANVQCIWAGELAPALELRGGALGDAARAIQLGTERNKVAQVGAYTLNLGEVVVATGAPDTATLTVTRGGGGVAEDTIRIDTPSPGQTVSSPLIVRGSARGAWFFEASFPVTLLDGHGAVLARGPAQAQGDWMTSGWVPFSATLAFPPPATTTGTLVVENANPSGDPAHVQSRRVDVRFANASGAGTGVRGNAHVGPTCPVVRSPPDPNCADRPYAGTLVVESVGGTRIGTVTTDAGGNFALALPPGSYRLRLEGNAVYPMLAPQPFTVRSDGWTTLDLALDSGIR